MPDPDEIESAANEPRDGQKISRTDSLVAFRSAATTVEN